MATPSSHFIWVRKVQFTAMPSRKSIVMCIFRGFMGKIWPLDLLNPNREYIGALFVSYTAFWGTSKCDYCFLVIIVISLIPLQRVKFVNIYIASFLLIFKTTGNLSWSCFVMSRLIFSGLIVIYLGFS